MSQTQTEPTAPARRKVYSIFPAKALPYASRCVGTLMAGAGEPVDLTILTDSADDRRQIEEAVGTCAEGTDHTLRVLDEDALAAAEADRFAAYPGLRRLRHGHPCWRKVTDPLLIADPGEEAVILDPDLYFPNRFRFEATPKAGVLVMHQRANCLLPDEAVRKVMEAGYPLANHVDIGVAQIVPSAVDLDWLDGLANVLGPDEFAPFMHIEAILWSALAMKMGGGYLDPSVWRCWQRGYFKRFLIAGGVPGPRLLRSEPLDRIKCIHVSGPSKWWVVEAEKAGVLKPFGNDFTAPSEPVPFVELTRTGYDREQAAKSVLRKVGYYKLSRS